MTSIRNPRTFGSKYRSKSSMNFRNDKEFLGAVRDEVAQYLEERRVPMACIDIRVDGREVQTQPGGGSVRLDISSHEVDTKPAQLEPPRRHWMDWTVDKPEMDVSTAENVEYGRPILSRAMGRPNTAYSMRSRANSPPGSRYDGRKCVAVVRPSPRIGRMDQAVGTTRQMSSVAVGPDRHYSDNATNTHKSYQLSDHLKKSMDLKDPYERKLFSSLMEVLRKKTGADSEDGYSIVGAPVCQLSEYRARYIHPRPASASVPPQSHWNPRPMSGLAATAAAGPCPHKNRPSSTSCRPVTSASTKFRHGEQFLY